MEQTKRNSETWTPLRNRRNRAWTEIAYHNENLAIPYKFFKFAWQLIHFLVHCVYLYESALLMVSSDAYVSEVIISNAGVE